MATKDGAGLSRAELQEAIKVQGEIIRKLKLGDQTDEAKNKVT